MWKRVAHPLLHYLIIHHIIRLLQVVYVFIEKVICWIQFRLGLACYSINNWSPDLRKQKKVKSHNTLLISPPYFRFFVYRPASIFPHRPKTAKKQTKTKKNAQKQVCCWVDPTPYLLITITSGYLHINIKMQNRLTSRPSALSRLTHSTSIAYYVCASWRGEGDSGRRGIGSKGHNATTFIIHIRSDRPRCVLYGACSMYTEFKLHLQWFITADLNHTLSCE